MRLLAVFAAICLIINVVHVTAQAPSYQVVSNQAGYQFQVPSDWVPGPVSDGRDTFIGSPTADEAADAVVRALEAPTAVAALQALTRSILVPSETRPSYTIATPPFPIQVAGADAANEAVATFVDQEDAPVREYVITAVRGATGYALMVDVPPGLDIASPSVVQTILDSLQLTSPEQVLTVAAAAPAAVPIMTPSPSSAADPPQLLSAATAAATPPGVQVVYKAGWNLVAAPAGTSIGGGTGSLYTLQAGDLMYEMVPNGSQVRAGAGYWALFPANTVVTIPPTTPGSITLPLSPGTPIMIGNSSSAVATVSGADEVYIFDPTSNNYAPVRTLSPGQGAWAMSAEGGSATISNP